MIGQYSLFDIEPPEYIPAPEGKYSADDICMTLYMQCPAGIRGSIKAGCSKNFVISGIVKHKIKPSVEADERGIYIRGKKMSWETYISVIRKVAEEIGGKK